MNPEIHIGCDVKPTVTLTGDGTAFFNNLGDGLFWLLIGFGIKQILNGANEICKTYTNHKEKMPQIEAQQKNDIAKIPAA